MRPSARALFGKQLVRLRVEEIVPAAIDRVLRTHESQSDSYRDEWGNWDVQVGQGANQLVSPDFDRYVIPGTATWPGGAPFAVCLTHDLDAIDHFSWAEYRIRIARAPFVSKVRSLLGFLKNRILLRRAQIWSFEDWLSLERQYGVRATWFVPPEDPHRPSPHDCSYRYDHSVHFEKGSRIPFDQALRQLLQEGHEIGLHGSISAALDADELRRQRKHLSETVRAPINSLRMHYLRFDPESTPRAVADAGFEVDSTIGFNRGVGFRASTSLPHRLTDPRTKEILDVVEVPFQIQEGALFRDWCLGLGMAKAKERTLEIVDAVEVAGGVLGLVYHPHLFTDPSVQEHFRWILEELKRRRAVFLTVTEAARAVGAQTVAGNDAP